VPFDIHPNDFGNLFEQPLILFRKSRRIVAVDVDLADYLSMGVNRDDDLRFGFYGARKISWIGVDIIDNNRFPRRDGSSADTLGHRDADVQCRIADERPSIRVSGSLESSM